jgi:hypothetical protein
MIVGNLYVGNSSTAALAPGSVISNQINLLNASVLQVLQPNGVLTGLTLNAPWADGSGLTIDGTSHLDLIFGQNTDPNWIFRWQDPSGANWESVLADMIGAGRIQIAAPNGYWLDDIAGYTYIEGGAAESSAVPEPSSLVIFIGFGVAGLVGSAWRRRRQA